MTCISSPLTSTPCPSPEPMSPVMSIAEVTAPSPPTTEPRGSQYCPAEVGGAIVTVPPTPGRNLEEVMLEVPPSQDMHELLQLIKVSREGKLTDNEVELSIVATIGE